MPELTLSLADRICDETLKAGTDLGLKPLAVAVVDAGGHLIAFKRADGASFFRFELAFGKAHAAAAFGFPSTGKLQGFFETRPLFKDYSFEASNGKMLIDAGGVRILNDEGHCIGAVGVTGDVSAQDEEAGHLGIKATGLISALG